MDEAERCDRVALIASGRLIALGSPDALRAQVGGQLIELAPDEPFGALRAARELPGVRQATLYGAKLHVLLADGVPAEALRVGLARAGHAVARLEAIPLSMEDVFAALVERPAASAAAPVVPSA
jgi:ABC-2 type transport system ATP-binding protein